jgi:formate hydrogenlyase subunit 4
MIHEAMVLDHGGPLLGFIQYGSCLKMWVTGSLVVSVLLPSAGAAGALAGLALLGMAAGLVESVAARLKLSRVPPLLVGAGATAVLGTVLLLGAAG